MSKKKVWFITGASKGLGLSLVKQLLATGHQVAATSRNAEELVKAAGGSNAQLLSLQTDLASATSVEQSINRTIDTFGRIDVIINNAGYGIGGSVEELSDEETRASFDINVFGTLNVIRSAMPHLRAQGAGHIINISSIAGIVAQTGWSIYAATKYAVVGLSEVLAADVKQFGINVTVVAPGAFRTQFLTQDSLSITRHPIAAYADVRAAHAKLLSMDGMQAGDPEKAAEAMIRITEEANPPLYLLLGSDALARATQKIDYLGKTFQEWEAVTKSTDFNS